MLDDGWQLGPPPLSNGRPRSRLAVPLTALVVVAVLGAAAFWGGPRPDGGPSGGAGPTPTPVARPGDAGLVIAAAAPSAWDPALVGDAESAEILSQVFEGLTALDTGNHVQPALATSWTLSPDGRQVTFALLAGMEFSDGSPITADDVVSSWLRVIDPARPSPLASLLGDVQGANEYLAGSGRASSVGIHAQGNEVVVQFRRPAAYFPSVAASPTLAVVPAGLPPGAAGHTLPPGMVVSGAYIPERQDQAGIRLSANPHYWAGRPAITSITVLSDLGNKTAVAAFSDGTVDYVPVRQQDATWIAYDPALGPQLRHAVDLAVSFFGFDVTKPPFNSADVRRAFAMAVDWHRIVLLDNASADVATSMVPPGLEGHGTVDYTPGYDPAAARAALAAAGYPGGKGLPAVTIVTGGGSYEAAVARQIKDSLGVTVNVEEMPFQQYSARLVSDTPQMWSLDWIADYPNAQDFLGLLLGTGSKSNMGHWSNAAFDSALEAAASTTDPVEQAAHFDAAQQIVRDQVPVIPLAYGEEWALSRAGLLGAGVSGTGFLRFAGLAWGDR